MEKISRAVETGRIIPFLAVTTCAITFVGGLAAWIFAPDGFDSLGDALWFAAQTVTTVGYGDVVPDTTAGRLIGLLIMLFGVAAVSVITGEDLRRQQIRTPVEALRGLPGVAVNRTGPLAGLTQVRIRGAEGNHTLVLIDGIEANNTADGEFDIFQAISREDVQRVARTYFTPESRVVLHILPKGSQQGAAAGDRR